MSAITKALNMESLFLPSHTHTHTHTNSAAVGIFFFNQRGKKNKVAWSFGLFWNCVMLSPKKGKKTLQQSKDKLARILVCFEIV